METNENTTNEKDTLVASTSNSVTAFKKPSIPALYLDIDSTTKDRLVRVDDILANILKTHQIEVC